MEQYEQARDEAVQQLRVADHVLTMTYPLVQDPKLLKLVLKNMHDAMGNSMKMLLSYERLYKRVPPFTENYGSMLQMLKPTLERYKISQGYISFLSEIQELVEKQKESEVEFVRKEKYVFASKEYDLDAISNKEIKDYLSKCKLFLKEATGAVSDDERRNGKRQGRA